MTLISIFFSFIIVFMLNIYALKNAAAFVPPLNTRRTTSVRQRAVLFISSWYSGELHPAFEMNLPQVIAGSNSVNYEIVYAPEKHEEFPVVTLFTRGGNDDTKGQEIVQALQSCQAESSFRHSLYVVDCSHTESQYWRAKYLYDLPVLHMGNMYWMVGRNFSLQRAQNSLLLGKEGTFAPGRDQPNWSDVARQTAVPTSIVTAPLTAPDRTSTNGSDTAAAPPRRVGNSSFQKQMIPGKDGSCKM